MKSIFTAISLIFCLTAFSQSSEEAEIKNTITAFFEEFHKQDSIALKKYVINDITLQSVLIDSSGKTNIKTTDFSDFLKSIVAIPEEINFDERILSIDVQSDGLIANAWTNYEFFINGKFSHCGVNSFQLINEKGIWKIFYIVDTRRSNCDKP
jgi:hypothetical protein